MDTLRVGAIGLGLVLAIGCGDGSRQGELNAHCYPNGTCNVTLACVGGVCVPASDAAIQDDASIDAEPDAAIDALPDARLDATPDALPPDAFCDLGTSMPDGHHNPGQPCIASGCHLTGQTGTNAPPFTYAGTLYTSAAATTPFPGGTIAITQGGVEKKAVTASNGNFFLSASPAGLDPPTNAITATARADACPNSFASMAGALVQGGGNCNNCHRNGGTTSPLHLP